MLHRRLVASLIALSALLTPFAADAQVIGTFRWRTEPFCNVLNLTVTQTGAGFTLNGFDESLGSVANLQLLGNLAPVSDSTIYYLRAVSAAPAPGLQLCGASVDYRLQ